VQNHCFNITKFRLSYYALSESYWLCNYKVGILMIKTVTFNIFGFENFAI